MLNEQALSEGKLSAKLTDLMGHVRLSLAIIALTCTLSSNWLHCHLCLHLKSHTNTTRAQQFEYEDPSVQPGDAGRVENVGEYQSMVQEEPYLGVGMQHMELGTARPPLKKGQGFAALFPY